jgi:hypothetical protein
MMKFNNPCDGSNMADMNCKPLYSLSLRVENCKIIFNVPQNRIKQKTRGTSACTTSTKRKKRKDESVRNDEA